MEQWEKEEVARKKLMKEIFEEQRKQIQDKSMIYFIAILLLLFCYFAIIDIFDF